jgi:hypothetical protein
MQTIHVHYGLELVRESDRGRMSVLSAFPKFAQANLIGKLRDAHVPVSTIYHVNDYFRSHLTGRQHLSILTVYTDLMSRCTVPMEFFLPGQWSYTETVRHVAIALVCNLDADDALWRGATNEMRQLHAQLQGAVDQTCLDGWTKPWTLGARELDCFNVWCVYLRFRDATTQSQGVSEIKMFAAHETGAGGMDKRKRDEVPDADDTTMASESSDSSSSSSVDHHAFKRPNVNSNATTQHDATLSTTSTTTPTKRVLHTYAEQHQMTHKVWHQHAWKKTRTIAHGTSVVHFLCEPLTANNIDFWKAYLEDQTTASRPDGGALNARGDNLPNGDGLVGFGDSLDLFSAKQTSYNMFVVYASRNASAEKDHRHTNPTSFDGIEMSFVLFASPAHPVTTHMGILRNRKYFGYFDEFEIHGNLALQLHGFAARSVRHLYDAMHTHMVTQPTPLMCRLFLSAVETYAAAHPYLQIRDLFSIGDDMQRQRDQIKLDRLQALLAWLQDSHNDERSDFVNTELQQVCGQGLDGLRNEVRPWKPLRQVVLECVEGRVARFHRLHAWFPASGKEPSLLNNSQAMEWKIVMQHASEPSLMSSVSSSSSSTPTHLVPSHITRSHMTIKKPMWFFGHRQLTGSLPTLVIRTSFLIDVAQHALLPPPATATHASTAPSACALM